jgi:hypothetical protein
MQDGLPHSALKHRAVCFYKPLAYFDHEGNKTRRQISLCLGGYSNSNINSFLTTKVQRHEDQTSLCLRVLVVIFYFNHSTPAAKRLAPNKILKQKINSIKWRYPRKPSDA